MRHIIILPPTLKSISADTGRIYNIPFLKGKSSKHTTWYIFSPQRLIYNYITNNHKDGKYIHAPIKEED